MYKQTQTERRLGRGVVGWPGRDRLHYQLFSMLSLEHVRLVVLHGDLTQPAVHLAQPVHESHLVLAEELRVGKGLLEELGLASAALLQLDEARLRGVQPCLHQLLVVHAADRPQALAQTNSLIQVFTVAHDVFLQGLSARGRGFRDVGRVGGGGSK